MNTVKPLILIAGILVAVLAFSSVSYAKPASVNNSQVTSIDHGKSKDKHKTKHKKEKASKERHKHAKNKSEKKQKEAKHKDKSAAE